MPKATLLESKKYEDPHFFHRYQKILLGVAAFLLGGGVGTFVGLFLLTGILSNPIVTGVVAAVVGAVSLTAITLLFIYGIERRVKYLLNSKLAASSPPTSVQFSSLFSTKASQAKVEIADILSNKKNSLKKSLKETTEKQKSEALKSLQKTVVLGESGEEAIVERFEKQAKRLVNNFERIIENHERDISYENAINGLAREVDSQLESDFRLYQNTLRIPYYPQPMNESTQVQVRPYYDVILREFFNFYDECSEVLKRFQKNIYDQRKILGAVGDFSEELRFGLIKQRIEDQIKASKKASKQKLDHLADADAADADSVHVSVASATAPTIVATSHQAAQLSQAELAALGQRVRLAPDNRTLAASSSTLAASSSAPTTTPTHR